MEKRKSKNIFGWIVIIFSLISVGLFIYYLLLLKTIETFLRIIGILILIDLIVMSIYSILDTHKREKKKKYIVSIILSLLLSFLSLGGASAIYSVYSKINTFNKNELSYKTVLVSFNNLGNIDKLKNKKIGIIEDKEDISNYILPNEVITRKKLEKENEIIKYNDSMTLMTSLIDGTIDAAFMASNYKEMFSSIEGFNRQEELKEIFTYSKNYKKSETDDEIPTSTKVTDPFTILLLGIDSQEKGIKSSSSFNGDTIMLISFDPKTFRATMFSIPRDTYVTMACGGNITKINHAAWGGTNCMVKTVELLTGINIDYYVKVNFQGVIDLVNTLGGITVDVPVDFCESDELRQTGSGYEICLKKGVQKLDGRQALALSRHRKSLPLGDFQRGQNQQLVVESILKSLKQIKTLNAFYDTLDTINDNIDTNMSTETMLSFYNVGKSMLLSSDDININITKTFLTGYDLYAYEGNSMSYTFQYYRKSLASIVKALNQTLGKEKKDVIKTIKFSLNAPYERKIIGYTYYSEERVKLIPDFTTYSLENAKSWIESNGLTLNINYVTDGVENYNNNQITYQSVHSGVLLQKAGSSITLNVVKKSTSSSQSPDISDKPEDTPTTTTNDDEQTE